MEHELVPASELPPAAISACVCGSQQNMGSMFLAKEHETHWRVDRTCSFCGSIDPDFLLGYLERGQATMEQATGKGYKWYARTTGDATFYQTYKSAAGEPWVTRKTNMVKLYTWHLSAEQVQRFNQLLGLSRAS